MERVGGVWARLEAARSGVEFFNTPSFLRLGGFRQWVLSILDLLGAESDPQLVYMESAAVDVDELVLQFDDAFHVARARLGDGSLSSADFEYLQVINDFLAAISNDSDRVWSREGLSGGAEWRELRHLSRRAATALENTWR
ncbi:hypothetical protein [Streptomyces mayteni]